MKWTEKWFLHSILLCLCWKLLNGRGLNSGQDEFASCGFPVNLGPPLSGPGGSLPGSGGGAGYICQRITKLSKTHFIEYVINAKFLHSLCAATYHLVWHWGLVSVLGVSGPHRSHSSTHWSCHIVHSEGKSGASCHKTSSSTLIIFLCKQCFCTKIVHISTIANMFIVYQP
jgi:hypothetical protein